MFKQLSALAAATLLAATPLLAQPASPAPTAPPPQPANPPSSSQPAPKGQPAPASPARLHLGIGDKPPPLEVQDWIKGEPIKELQPGQVYVVEFWATWCYPCRESIPHLSQLQRDFKDQGVTVIGVAASERGGSEDEKLGTLEKFVKDKGDEIAYRIAFDPGRRMSDSWLRAAEISTIPTAFIIGRSGRITWIGHPMNGMDAALRTTLAKSKPEKHAQAADAVIHLADHQPQQPQPAPKQPKSPEAPAEDAGKLALGDRAPSITVGKWIKGEPIKEFQPGQVYVVEFWSTWCPICRKSIPHLTELQKKFGDKARFVGVSIWEKDPKTVPGFVEQRGDEMAYTVAIDEVSGNEGKMASHWMDAAAQNSIPTAFVVNGEGRIAWIGHPNDAGDTLSKVLDKVIAGTWDIQKEAAAQKKLTEQEQKVQSALFKLKIARGANDVDAELAAIDEALALDPNALDNNDPQMAYPLAAEKFRLMLTEKDDPDKAYIYGRAAVDGALKNSAEGLNMVAWTIVDPQGPDLKKRDLDLAMKAAQRAMDLTSNKDGMIADTLARVYYEKHDLDKALELQEQAVKLIDNGTFNGSPELRASIREELQGRLEEYRDEAKKGRG